MNRASTPSPLLRRARPTGADGVVARVTPAEPDWEFVSLAIHRLTAGGIVHRAAGADEVAVIVLEGRASIQAGDHSFPDLGSRTSVFDGPPPPLVLVEPGLSIDVSATSDTLVAIASAPGGETKLTRAFSPGEILVETRGTGNTQRRVHHLLPSAVPAGRLLAFEVFTPGGNWSSFPPHKHDTENPPVEARLEELYFYRFARPAGFAVQRVYTADGTLDETVVARDGDVVLVPRGYHVVAAAPGYDCYYLNVMAGPGREWRFTVDPDHSWLMDWDPGRPEGTNPEPDGGSR